MTSETDGSLIPAKKAGRGRPRKPPGSDMVPRNMSLTPQDEEALRLLSGRIQLYHTYTLGYPPEGFSVSWAIRALIRFADAETASWKFQDTSLLLERLVEHGMRDPREEPAKLPSPVRFTNVVEVVPIDPGLPVTTTAKMSSEPPRAPSKIAGGPK